MGNTGGDKKKVDKTVRSNPQVSKQTYVTATFGDEFGRGNGSKKNGESVDERRPQVARGVLSPATEFLFGEENKKAKAEWLITL